MFGFLKQKLAEFGNKLKKTVAQEEQKQPAPPVTPAVEQPAKEEIKISPAAPVPESAPPQQMPTPPQPSAQEIQTPAPTPALPKAEALPIPAPLPPTHPAPKSVESPKTETAPAPEKKKGLLGKLFGGGKKQEQKTPAPKAAAKPAIKISREEVARELEEKMFAKIQAEIAEEQRQKLALPVIEELPAEVAPRTVEKERLEKKPTPPSTPIVSPSVEEKEELEELEEEPELVAPLPPPAIEPPPVRIEKPRDIKVKTITEDKRELKATVGVASGIKGFLFGGVEITEKEITQLLWELELSLLESDVEQDAATELITQIKQRLLGTKVSAKNIDAYLKDQIKDILAEMMRTEAIDLLAQANEHHPLKILMLGPNGAGKTTSIAKLVRYFQKNGKQCILAAGDTFRAGAIDQLEEHAQRLGVRIVKQQYGADPAAVAFDAIKAAEAGKIDVVIIDSAGRQETNKNLMEELRKLERVANPDVKLYVGEAYVGQTLLEQVREFEEIAGIDGFILTKIDTDAKGGTAISLLYKTKKPIVFVGTGQGYDDLAPFTPEFILDRIL